MKKFLTLVLALVMALALTVPAMAFTSTTPAEDGNPELDIYLVEYEDDDFFGIVGLPASDRGYAKNEVVAAVAELNVPEDVSLADYDSLEISGDNASLNVTDNDWAKVPAAGLTAPTDVWAYASKVATRNLSGLSDDETYKWLFFAKVTGDEASLTFTLIADSSADGLELASPTDLTMDMGDYGVTAATTGTGSDQEWTFTVSDVSPTGQDLFIITTDEDFESTGLQIVYDGTSDVLYTVVALKSGLGFIAEGTAVLEDDKDILRDLLEIYEDVFVGEFGFDFDLIGGVVDADTFTDYAGTDDIEATVEIKPWTAYVTVPDNIVVDPPKTGDAASIVGFVMIVLAAAAVVAVKKVRA